MSDDQVGKIVSTLHPAHVDGEVTTFWRFDRKPIVGGGISLKLRQRADFPQGTATMVPIDWNILYYETCQIEIEAKQRGLSVKAVKSIAPNLAHWSKETDLQRFLDQCSGADEGAESNLDALDRQKRIPVKGFVDDLMAVRLGRSAETIRSYRERWARKQGDKNLVFRSTGVGKTSSHGEA